MTRRLPIISLLAAALTIGGCATDQQADVRAYRSLTDPPGVMPTHERNAPLSLEHALRLATAYNEQLSVQGERYIQALAEQQRLAAALRPTFDFFSALQLQENTGDNIAANDVGVRGQYRLMTGMSDLNNVRSAEARADAAMWLILDLREALLVQVTRAYYEALRSQRLAGVLNNSLNAQMERLTDAKARNEVGFTRPLDVAQIEAQTSRTRTQVIVAEQAHREARATLKLLTNADVAESPLTDGFQPPDTQASMNDLVRLAKHNRQDILAAWSDADAARAAVDSAIGRYWPTITLNLEYFLSRTPEASLPAVASLVSLRVPVFSAGEIEADVRGAWSLFRERVLTYRLRLREAERDVEIAAHRLAAARDLIAQSRVRVRTANDAVELAEAAYDAGLGTNLERVVAQDELLNAELDAVVADFGVKIAYLELLRACGLLGRDVIAAPVPPLPPEDRPATDSPVIERSPASPTPLTGQSMPTRTGGAE